MPDLLVSDLKTMDYVACLKLQRAVHAAHVNDLIPDTLLLVEHPHVLTFGRRAHPENVLVSRSVLQQMGVTCAHVERGGDVTYHGPGQILAYPIFALQKKGIGVLDFVEKLETVMIRVLRDYGIRGERDDRNRGVWVNGRKIGFVGIAVKKGISLHGLSLNINPDLNFFQMIHPCGLKEVDITSMAELLNETILLDEIKTLILFHFQRIFHVHLDRMEASELSKLVNEPYDD